MPNHFDPLVADIRRRVIDKYGDEIKEGQLGLFMVFETLDDNRFKHDVHPTKVKYSANLYLPKSAYCLLESKPYKPELHSIKYSRN